jgi:hypothetical protein
MSYNCESGTSEFNIVEVKMQQSQFTRKSVSKFLSNVKNFQEGGKQTAAVQSNFTERKPININVITTMNKDCSTQTHFTMHE